MIGTGGMMKRYAWALSVGCMCGAAVLCYVALTGDGYRSDQPSPPVSASVHNPNLSPERLKDGSPSVAITSSTEKQTNEPNAASLKQLQETIMVGDLDAGLKQLQNYTKLRPDLVAGDFSKFITPLVTAQKFTQLAELCSEIIPYIADNASTLADCQRTLAISLKKMGKPTEAREASVAYYLICPTRDIDSGVATLAADLSEKSPELSVEFLKCQLASSDKSTDAILSLIKPPAISCPFLKDFYSKKNVYDQSMANGNVCLLNRDFSGAEKCFRQAIITDPNGKHLVAAIEGIAKCSRGKNASIGASKLLIDRLRSTGSIDNLDSQYNSAVKAAASRLEVAIASDALKIPALEYDRENIALSLSSQKSVAASQDAACGYAPQLSQVEPNYWSITFQRNRAWWYCVKFVGEPGTIVRLDLNNVALSKWKGVHAVTKNLETVPLDIQSSINSWSTVPDAWISGANTTSVVVKLQSKSQVIAVRPGYGPEDEKLNAERQSQYLSTEIVATSDTGHPIRIYKVSSQHDIRFPTVVMYSREHADEPDGSWAIQGAIDYLLSDDPEAIQARGEANYWFIPLLDPDGALASEHGGMSGMFSSMASTPAAVAIASYFSKHLNDGGRIDMVLNFHNLEGGEGAAVNQMWCNNPNIATAFARLHNPLFQDDAITVGKGVPQGFRETTRLGGFLERASGCFHILYELNSRSQQGELNISQLRRIGAVFVQAARAFLASSDGRSSQQQVTDTLNSRQKTIEERQLDIRKIGPYSFEELANQGLAKKGSK